MHPMGTGLLVSSATASNPGKPELTRSAAVCFPSSKETLGIGARGHDLNLLHADD